VREASGRAGADAAVGTGRGGEGGAAAGTGVAGGAFVGIGVGVELGAGVAAGVLAEERSITTGSRSPPVLQDTSSAASTPRRDFFMAAFSVFPRLETEACSAPKSA
jgi:hypothetical protein